MTIARKLMPPQPSCEWAYFLDVDGTLIEIAERPDAVRVDDALLGLAARLHHACGGALALVSGRALGDLDERLGSVRIPLAGQHGLERRDAVGRVHTHAATPAARTEIRTRLEPLLARHPDLLLEDKGLSMALHYRQAPRLAPYLHRQLGAIVGNRAGLCLQPGKRVIEVKPAGYDKGTAVAEFMAEAPFAGRRPVFIGDDASDEHGFAIVNLHEGVSVKVGPGPSAALHRLPSVAAVRAWLALALGPRQPSGNRA